MRVLLFLLFSLLVCPAWSQSDQVPFTINGKEYSNQYYYFSHVYEIQTNRNNDDEYWKKVRAYYFDMVSKRWETECQKEILEGFATIEALKAYYNYENLNKENSDYLKDTAIVEISYVGKAALFTAQSHSSYDPWSIGNKEGAAKNKLVAVVPYRAVSKVNIHNATDRNMSDTSNKFWESRQEIAIFSYCSLQMKKGEKRFVLVRPIHSTSMEVAIIYPEDGAIDYLASTKLED